MKHRYQIVESDKPQKGAFKIIITGMKTCATTDYHPTLASAIKCLEDGFGVKQKDINIDPELVLKYALEWERKAVALMDGMLTASLAYKLLTP